MDIGQALTIFANQQPAISSQIDGSLAPDTVTPTSRPAQSGRPTGTNEAREPAQKTTVTQAGKPATATPSSKDSFDFYVLSLSWSPDYCAGSGGDDTQQCSIGKKLGFVLHGLWPNYTRGYPSNCSTQKLPAAVKAKFPNLYPSESLYDHEWEKHGTCSGLEPEAYLTLSKKLKESVKIPDAYRSLPSNPSALLSKS